LCVSCRDAPATWGGWPLLPGRHSIAHMDLKSTNILLDRSCTAKIADVGMAKLERMGFVSLTHRYAENFAWLVRVPWTSRSLRMEACMACLGGIDARGAQARAERPPRRCRLC
jgi:serine/threonine protein kinase